MAENPFLAKVVGIPHIPSITQVNVRSGPGTNFLLIAKVAVGTTNLPVLAVQQDAEDRNLGGKVYQWFKLMLPSGQGWIRDDLIEVWGDGMAFGYPVITKPVLGFNLHRRDVVQGTEPAAEETPDKPIEIHDPEPETTTEPAPPTSAPGSGEGTATSMALGGVNTRPGPGTNYAPPVGKIPYRESATILAAKQGEDGKDFLWAKLNYQSQEVWAREDFLRLSGSFEQFGLAHEDQYPSPVPQSWWIRDFDMDGSRIGVVHHGWDHAGDKGFPILAGPQGGYVYKVAHCQRCTPAGYSTVDKGYSLGDSRIFRDAGWNYGYGHYIIMRYTHGLLPDSTKAELANRSFAGGHLFVMYAHLQDILVQQGDTVTANQQIATLGNSGNSSGPHLHLEVRASKSENPTSWASIVSGLMTPAVLFLR